MGTPVGKTPKTTQNARQKPVTKKNTAKTQQGQNAQKAQPKKREYAVGADGRKIDVTSVFDQIEKNTQQDLKDQEKFMQDMFGEVL